MTPEPGVVFTDRRGGHSSRPYDSLNLGFATGDDAGRVWKNRRLVSTMLGVDHRWVTAHQVHGSVVVEADHGNAGGPPPRPKGDVVVTRTPGLPIAVLTADCVPIALIGESTIAAIHAGWRGIAKGVIQAGVAAAGDRLRAHIGPSIGPCHFEVQQDVVEAFASSTPNSKRFVVESSEGTFIDLPSMCRDILEESGVVVESQNPTCTHCSPDFFSYRRDGKTGRQALIMWKP